jgi:hypothetical protein
MGIASTRSHNVTEREEFEAAIHDLASRPEDSHEKPYFSDEANAMWGIWQAARRTTPDREAIIEECAKVCEDVASRRSVVEMSIGAAMCAGRIRELKTAPNGEKV